MNAPQTTTILLIRHAQSVWNTQENQLCGSTDVALLPEGLEKTECLARALAGRRVDAIYCTPLQRSALTAQAIARHHDGLKPIVVEDLREIDYGQWEGLSYPQIAARDPELYGQWMDDPTDVRPPDGDTPREVAKRAFSAITALVQKHRGQTIAVVAHKTLNRLILCQTLKIPIGRFRKAIKQNNLAVNEIRFIGDEAKVIHLNDICHLQGDIGPDS